MLTNDTLNQIAFIHPSLAKATVEFYSEDYWNFDPADLSERIDLELVKLTDAEMGAFAHILATNESALTDDPTSHSAFGFAA